MTAGRQWIFLLLFLPLTVHSQWRGGIEAGTLFDDNVFNNSLQIADRVSELSLQGAYEWTTGGHDLQLFYSGILDYFALLPARTFQLHTAGLAYTREPEEDTGTLWNAGVDLSLRDNREDYTIYDYIQFSLYANLHAELGEQFRLKGGYSLRSVAFSELQEFDYLEHVFFVQAATSLPSATTFIAQADLGFKSYATPNADTTIATSSTGRRAGRSNVSAAPAVSQLITTLRIGQGITGSTGLSLTGQYQVSLAKESRYLLVEGGILTDDEIFDDHYGFDGPSLSLTATQILPGDMQFRVSGSVQERRYSSRPAFDLSGMELAPQRIDTRQVVSLSLEKSFDALGLRAALSYDIIRNLSNDTQYTYRNHAVALSVSFLH